MDPEKLRYAFSTGRGCNFDIDAPGTVAVRRRVIGHRGDIVVHHVTKEQVIIILLIIWKVVVVY